MPSLSHYSQFVALRVLEGLVRVLPRPIALRMGARGGSLLYRSGAYRKVVRGNLEHVGLWDEGEMARITRSLYRTTGRYWVDFLKPARSLPPHEIANHHLIEELSMRGRGILALLGHFGSWEVLARIFGARIPDLTVIGKPMHNPYVNEWLTRKRTATGVSVISPERALRKSMQILKRNGMIGMLIDQHAGKLGAVVPFLGKPASTIRTAAGLQMRTGCSVLPAYALLTPAGTYRVTLEMMDDSPSKLDREDPVTALQIKHNEILSRWIRDNPDHWFGWFHRRFRASLRY